MDHGPDLRPWLAVPVPGGRNPNSLRGPFKTPGCVLRGRWLMWGCWIFLRDASATTASGSGVTQASSKPCWKD